jgi:hypothetical protein
MHSIRVHSGKFLFYLEAQTSLETTTVTSYPTLKGFCEYSRNFSFWLPSSSSPFVRPVALKFYCAKEAPGELRRTDCPASPFSRDSDSEGLDEF